MRVYTHSMSVVTAYGLMIFYINMNLTCTGLGVRVSNPSMVVFSNSMKPTSIGLCVRVPTSKSLVLINTSVYLFNPGRGKKVPTSSMRVPTS